MADAHRRRLRGLPLLVMVGLLLAGCAGIPTSGSVHVGRAVPAVGGAAQDDIRVLPPPPEPGMSALAVVRAFLQATVDADDDYAAARAYLAPGAAWTTSVGTTTYDESGLVLSRIGSTEVRVRAPQVGTISSRGDYRSSPGTLERRFSLVRQAGQWRISRLPAGVLLATVDAQRSLEQVSVYYLNPAQNALVPEQVLVAPEQPGTATTLVRALLSGPPAPFSSAMSSAVPPGTRLLGNVPVGTDGVAQVDLSFPLHPVSRQTLGRMSAQLIWTLRQLPDVTAVQLLVDGDALIAPGFPRLQTTASWAAYDPSAAPTPSGVLYVRGGRVKAVGESVPPALAHLTQLRSPAVGAGGAEASALRQRGSVVQLLMGPASGGLRVRLSAPAIAAPSFDRAGELITATDSALGWRIVELSAVGGPEVVQAPASLLDEGIGDVAVSPDGARLALTVGPPGARRLVIALVGRHRGQLSLVAVDEIPVGPDPQGLAWNGSGELVTTILDGAHERLVVGTDTVGYQPHPLTAAPVPNRSDQVAVAGREPVYAAAGGVLYRLEASRWRRLSPGTDPSYAG